MKSRFKGIFRSNQEDINVNKNKEAKKESSEDISSEETKNNEDQEASVMDIPPILEKKISKYQKNIEKAKKRFKTTGESDGKQSLYCQSVIENIAREEAHITLEEIKADMTGTNAMLEEKEAKSRIIAEKLEKDYESKRKERKSLELKRAVEPKAFSKGLGVLYLVFAIFLLIADIPLSVELIRDGFALKTAENWPIDGKTEIPTRGKIVNRDSTQSEYYSIQLEHLFYSPSNLFRVFFANWETFFTAFGIVITMLYIKVFYDEYILSSPGNLRLYHIYRTKEVFEFEGVQNSSVKRKLHAQFYGRAFFKVLILLLVLTTLGYISIYRFNKVRSDAQTTIFKQYKLNLALNGEQVQRNSPEFETYLNEHENYQPFNEKNQNTTRFAFIGISILFPLIGGVLFSLGWSYIQNAQLLVTLDDQEVESRNAFEDKKRDLEEDLRELTIWKTHKENYLKDYNRLAKLYLAQYDKGYYEGLMSSHSSSSDLYDKILILRKKSLENDINKKLLDGITKI